MKYISLLIYMSCTIGVSAQDKNDGIHKSEFTRIGRSGNFTYLLPEFYSRFIKPDKDTTWKFECYDSRDSVMNIDTVQSATDIKYFSLFKSYTDSAHTYDDSNGKKQLLPVSSIIKRYDRTGKDGWLSVDYTNNKYIELKEFTQDIVKTDTVTIQDPVTEKWKYTFYKYYKVIPVK